MTQTPNPRLHAPHGLRVALHDPFDPEHPAAERELAMRMAVAGKRKGWTMHIVGTVDEIEAFAPDLVVALHSEAPKLTRFPTLGCLWNPPAHMEDDPAALARLLSYDGFLTAGPVMRRFVESSFFPTHRSAITAPIYPATHDADLAPCIGPDSRLFYVGSNWDGRRYERLFRRLAGTGLLAAFGPTGAWEYVGDAYAGPLPFDGRTLLDTANRLGIGLCLHLPGHTATAVPNMRIFELATAGALAICGRHPFIEEQFGDAVLTIDADAPPDDLAEMVAAHVRWARANPGPANAMAARAQSIVRKGLSLDRLMDFWPPTLESVRTACGFDPAPDEPEAVRYVLPVTESTPDTIRRTLESVAAQTHRAVGVILTGTAAALDDVRSRLDGFGPCVTAAVPTKEENKDGLWSGLRTLDAPWFGVLDAGTVLFPNHCASLLATARRAQADLVFGHAAVHGEAGWDVAPHGALRDRELPGDRLTVPPAGFLARRHLLDARLLRDPGLGSAGQLYLFRRLVTRAGAVPSWLTTLASVRPSLPPEERRELERLERLDATVQAAVAPAPAPPPAPPGDMGAAVLTGLPVLREPRDFAALPPDRPIHIYGSSRGGRLVQLELMKHPDLHITGFLDSRTAGEAWGLPVRVSAEIPMEMLAAATVIIASQHVAEIATLLKRLGQTSPINAYPYIATYTAFR